MSAVLLTRLKIADLTALTALDTARRLLPPGHAIDRLVREDLFLFTPEAGAASDAFEPALALAIESSNFFVNPNKERYRFLPAAERGASLAPPEGAWGILVRPRDDTRDEGLLARLRREHPLAGLGAIRRARLWWLWTRGPAGDQAAAEAYEAVGPVTGTRSGLLVNPHAEASLAIGTPLAWRELEAFLADPAPAMRAA
ncbi:MAG: hypothetical protein ACM3JJ_03055 [Hyphomicrobiales bacterium]